MSFQISRRTVLRGMGCALALPLLEAMMPLTALAASPKRRVVRAAFLFVPNGIHMPAWTPAAEGAGFPLPPTLMPLAPFRDSIMVLTGLTQHNADGLGDGAGDHARSASTWLTGCHIKKTAGSDLKSGISVDQIMAQEIGSATPFPSLELGCERGAVAGECDSGYSCAYSSTIAWQSPETPVAKEVMPRAVFDRLFAGDDPGETAQNRARRAQYNQSILDFVSDDAASLQKKLGARDKEKLDEYFTGVRQIERRLSRAQDMKATASVAAMRPPAGIPDDYGDHLRLMGDMVALAFQTDMTRVVTFMFANEGSNRPFNLIGIPEGHHDLSHHGGHKDKQAKLQQINTFQIEQVAYLLGRLQSIKEPEGSLLDNSMIVFGGGISDGDMHNHDNLPILVAGKGGETFSTGRHVTYQDGTPLTNLFLSMLDRVGVREDRVGDSTGRLQRLV